MQVVLESSKAAQDNFRGAQETSVFSHFSQTTASEANRTARHKFKQQNTLYYVKKLRLSLETDVSLRLGYPIDQFARRLLHPKRHHRVGNFEHYIDPSRSCMVAGQIVENFACKLSSVFS